MTLERMSIKKGYYYVICTVTFLVLMWGAIDVVSSLVSYIVFRPPEVSMESPTTPKGGMPSDAKGGTEPFIDEYYQSRMIFDRMGDSIARIIVSGILFAYFSQKIKTIEAAEQI